MNDKSTKGFASMDKDKVEQIAHKGGEVRKEQLGHEGYVEMGRKGGQTRKEQLGHEGYSEMGHKGGQVRKEQLGHGGYVELGHKGGVAKGAANANRDQDDGGKGANGSRHDDDAHRKTARSKSKGE